MKQKKVSVWLPQSKADSLYCRLTARLQKKPGASRRMSSVQHGSPSQTPFPDRLQRGARPEIPPDYRKGMPRARLLLCQDATAVHMAVSPGILRIPLWLCCACSPREDKMAWESHYGTSRDLPQMLPSLSGHMLTAHVQGPGRCQEPRQHWRQVQLCQAGVVLGRRKCFTDVKHLLCLYPAAQ